MNDNDTLADDLRQDSLALMKLLADEKHKSEALAAELAALKSLEANIAQWTTPELTEAYGRIRALEAAMREACGLMVRFIVEGDSTVEESVDAFLIRQTEYSGVTSNAFTAETKAEHMEGCRCPECDPDFNDPRGTGTEP